MLICCLKFPSSTLPKVFVDLESKLDISCAPDEVRELLHLQFDSREVPHLPDDLKSDLQRDLKKITTESAFPKLWQATFSKSNNAHNAKKYLKACADGLAQDLKDLAPDIPTDKLETFFTQCLLQKSINYYRSIMTVLFFFLANVKENSRVLANNSQGKALTAALLLFDPSQKNLKLYSIHIPFVMRSENHSLVPGLVMQQVTAFNLATAAISIDFRFSCYQNSTGSEFEQMLRSSSLESILNYLASKDPARLERLVKKNPEILENYPGINLRWQIANSKKDDNEDGKTNHTDIAAHKKSSKSGALQKVQMTINQKLKHFFLFYLRLAFSDDEFTIEDPPESSQAFLIKPTAKSIWQSQMNAHFQEKKPEDELQKDGEALEGITASINL